MSLIYEITPTSPHKHLFSVSVTVPEPNPLGQVFKLPSWIPGSYLIRDFAKNIVTLSAKSDSKVIATKKLDKSHWICDPCEKSITIDYQIYAYDLSVRSAYLTNERAFFNGTSVFLLPLGFEDDECQLTINLPSTDQVLGEWQCATTLKPKSKSRNLEIYTAQNYYDLVDHPVEISDFTLFEFDVHKIQHEMAITGIHSTDIERLRVDLISICEHHIDFFGGDVPFSRYLFLTLVRSHGYGGLEHKDSTSLICSRVDLPSPGMVSIGPEYTKFLALCSHEYFHAWWIKTIKPIAFHNINLDIENYTEQLWIFEGFTSYYDELSLLRANILTPDQYLALFSQTVTKVQRSKGRLRQSIAESSFDAWTKFYQQDENSVNSIVSYYSKGALVAFILDIEIRRLTNDGLSLDDVVRYIWNNFKQEGLSDDTVKLVVEKLTKLDFTKFFNAYIYGVEELPLKESFKYLGVKCTFKNNSSDLYGFGVSAKNKNDMSLITHVFDNSNAQKYGLYVGDTVVTVDKFKVTFSELPGLISAKVVGDTISIGVLRDDLLVDILVKICDPEKTSCTLEIDKIKDKAINGRQKKWLNGH